MDVGSHQEHGAPARKHDGRGRHPRSIANSGLPRQKSEPKTEFKRALLALIPPNTPRFYWLAIELFEERVKYATIRKWCQGYYQPPQWAIDHLIEQCRLRAAAMAAVLAELEKQKGRG